MEGTRGVKVVEVVKGGVRRGEWEIVPNYLFFDVVVNGKKVGEVKGLPGRMEEAGIGFLLCNGYLEDPGIVEEVKVEEGKVEIRAESEFDFKYEYVKEEGPEIPRINSHYVVSPEKIWEKIGTGLERIALSRDIPGVHFSILSDDNGALFVAEDVVGETTVYKVVGEAVGENFDFRRSFLITSHPITPEFVVYTSLLGIPILGTLSGITGTALDIASSLSNQTLLRVEGERMFLYHGAGRVRD